MLNVALTGNAAAGKSTVSDLLAGWGATLIDADAIVRQLQLPGQPLNAVIAEALGGDAVAPDGSLDRAWLRRRILEDATARETLNAIVHPAVQQRRAEETAEARRRGDCIVVHDIPLLFEVMDPSQFDLVILVEARDDTRVRRLMDRGLDRQQARALMAAQLPSAHKRAGADFIIENEGTVAELHEQAATVWSAIRRRGAAPTGVAGERLVAVFGDCYDATRYAGGTLARYADGGVDIQLLCSPSADTGGRTAIDLAGLAPVLGISCIQRVAPARVQRVIEDFQPSIVLTDGTPDVAHPSARHSGAEFFVTSHEQSANVVIDVRPWADKKRNAIGLFESAEPGPEQVEFTREWFDNSGAAESRFSDLFASSWRA